MMLVMKKDYVTDKAVALLRKLHPVGIGAKNLENNGTPLDALMFSTTSSFWINTQVDYDEFVADRREKLKADPELDVGRYRYYACPVDLIEPWELPGKWGLIHVPADNMKAVMLKGYGGWLEEKEGMRYQGTPCPPGVKRLDNYYRRPEYPANLFSFDEGCLQKEGEYILALAHKYKANVFMGDML